MGKTRSVSFYYCIVLLVVVLWGIAPIVTDYLLRFYSPTIETFLYYFLSGLILFFVYFKNFKSLTKECFKVAFYTGIFLAIGNIIIKIGLFYTTPSNYAFLENLQMVFVPIVVFFMTGEKPTIITIFSCLLCLVGCATLCGIFSNFTIAWGDLLCCLATVFFGISIGATGCKLKKFDPGTFVTIQLFVSAFMALLTAIGFNFIKINGSPIEPLVFSFNPVHIVVVIVLSTVSGASCWSLRTISLKHVNTTVYTIMLSISAIITTIISLIIGTDKFSYSLLIGALLILFAVVISGLGDIIRDKRKKLE